MVPFLQICACAESSSGPCEDGAEEGGFGVVPAEEGVELIVAEVVDAV